MNNDEHKQKVKASFDMASDGYDCPSLRFFTASASYLIELMKLKGNEDFLDIATGTGNVAIAAAQKIKGGSVTGIDLSEKMLQKAAQKAADMKLANVKFMQADLENMGFDNHSFDAVSCAFGLFFLQNVENGLNCISRVLKHGGMLGVTSFTTSFMMPLRDMFFSMIKSYGVEGPQRLLIEMDSPEKITSLLSGAGYCDIKVISKQMGYHLKNSLDWWEVLWNSGSRGMLGQFSQEDLNRFMKEHLEEVERIADDKGIWLDVEVLFATATVRK